MRPVRNLADGARDATACAARPAKGEEIAARVVEGESKMSPSDANMTIRPK